jgi:hypothetical protein
MWARPCPVTIPSRPHELDRGQLRSRPALGRAALTPGPSRRPAGPLAWVGAVALPGRSVPRSRACPGHPLVPCPPFRCPSLALVPSLPEPACSARWTRAASWPETARPRSRMGRACGWGRGEWTWVDSAPGLAGRGWAGQAPTFAHVAASGPGGRSAPAETPGRTRANGAWRRLVGGR